jgi:hypothetical protein
LTLWLFDINKITSILKLSKFSGTKISMLSIVVYTTLPRLRLLYDMNA